MHTRDCRKSFFLRKIESRADHESRLICATWHRATYPTQLNLINMPNRVGVPPDSGSKINAPGCQLKQNTQLINMPNRVGVPPASDSDINMPGCHLKQSRQLINMPNRVGVPPASD